MKNYSEQELQIELLKQRNQYAENNIASIRNDTFEILKVTKNEMNQIIKEIKSEMKSNFHILLGLILGIYGVITAGGLGILVNNLIK